MLKSSVLLGGASLDQESYFIAVFRYIPVFYQKIIAKSLT
ncbi:hypothetical protein PLUTE_a2496 [Pseudoalteromonas luteoviolacea DSM 6061]|nr:hypothetical protein [Pseudoalteromonas luteoviolacea DSM 6061]